MKVLLHWISDPYLHLIGIVLCLVGFASAIPREPDDDRIGPALVIVCAECHRGHDPTLPCPSLAAGPTLAGVLE